MDRVDASDYNLTASSILNSYPWLECVHDFTHTSMPAGGGGEKLKAKSLKLEQAEKKNREGGADSITPAMWN